METDREKIIAELRERLQYFSDERLKLLYKSSMPVTEQDIQADIIRLSKNIRADNTKRF